MPIDNDPLEMLRAAGEAVEDPSPAARARARARLDAELRRTSRARRSWLTAAAAALVACLVVLALGLRPARVELGTVRLDATTARIVERASSLAADIDAIQSQLGRIPPDPDDARRLRMRLRSEEDELDGLCAELPFERLLDTCSP
jgi:hypothetical protein